MNGQSRRSVASLLAGIGVGTVASWLWQLLARRGRRRRRLRGRDAVFPVRLPAFRQLVVRLGQAQGRRLQRDLGLEKPLQFQAQDGEDMLLAALFAYRRAGFFIEIGAYDGIKYSNSYVFEQLGWRGILVEPLPAQAAACRRNRPGSQVVQAAIASGSSATVTLTEVVGDNGGIPLSLLSHVKPTPGLAAKAARLSDRLIAHEVPRYSFGEIAAHCGLRAGTPIDFISIDCEGMDFEVLQSIDLTRWRPRIFIIEHTPPPLIAYLRRHGYEVSLRLQANQIFSRERADQEYLTVAGFWQALLPPSPH